ncbi:MAG: formylglycine-generating enzyme family protein [Anaerolineae bacterium]|nr:formylglycine-generating enzyme family protein [Anaerolineae bacterium]
MPDEGLGQETMETVQFSTVTVNITGEVVEETTQSAQRFTEVLGPGLTLEMVLVPGGVYLMGSLGGGDEDEHPQHRVTVAPFLLGQYPVSQAQWQALMGGNPSRFKGPTRPVDNVSWRDARRFCERLSRRTGRHYDLPSEAQWEYACRAGSATPFAYGPTLTTDLANYNGEFTYRGGPRGVYRHVTTEAGSFPPNVFGLYDMHGNVWEWCADPWHASYAGAPSDSRVWTSGGDPKQRVARGGCWHDTPEVCRSATRLKYPLDEGDEILGFRVALPI